MIIDSFQVFISFFLNLSQMNNSKFLFWCFHIASGESEIWKIFFVFY